jgi:uncharacterized membrane protein YbhN (UPF0104 family)
MKRTWRPVAAVIILAATIGAFVYYFRRHPSVGHQLHHTSPALLVWLLFLYAGTIAALAMTTLASLRICKIKLAASESLLLTAYTAVLNFFGPLQSGPAFRGVYLKARHGLNLKDYTLVTVLYLGFWGIYSGLFLISGLLGWWLIPLAILGALILYMEYRTPRITKRFRHLNLRPVLYLAIATFLQAAVVCIIYYSELRSIAPATRFSQAIIYTGAANLALFVSLTPAAIGFRESFLLFSRHLHHISSNTIVTASILDRSVYVVFLILLAILIFSTHASRRLQASKNKIE